MISTSIDQLVKFIAPWPDGGPYAADRSPHAEPPFGTHLHQAGSGESSVPAEPSPSADSPRRDSQGARSSDVEPPADRSAESSGPPTDQSPVARKSDEADDRDAATDDREDTQHREPDQTADAAVAVAGDPPANAVRADADATSADATPHIEQPPADPSVLPAEDAEPRTDRDGDRVIETDNAPTETDDIAPKAERGPAIPDVTVRPTTDESAEASDQPAPSGKSRPTVANRKQADAQAANGAADAAEADNASRPAVHITQGETAAPPDELAAADVDGNEDRTSDRRARSDRQTNSVERESRQISPPGSERAGARSAGSQAVAAQLADESTVSATAEAERVLSAVKSGPDAEDAGQRDEPPAESRPQGDRPRPVAGARALAVQNVVAASAEAALTTEGGASPADAASNPDAKRTATDTNDSLLTTFARYDRSGPLGARGMHRGGDGQEMPHVDPARFISRVARAIHTAHERGGPLQLRLSPPELGSLRLELSVKQGVLTANVETDNATARQVLLDNLPALRDRLAEQNVRIERFDVGVRRDGGEQPHFGPQHRDHQQPRHSPPPSRAAIQHSPGGDEAAGEAASVRRAITDTSINVIA